MLFVTEYRNYPNVDHSGTDGIYCNEKVLYVLILKDVQYVSIKVKSWTYYVNLKNNKGSLEFIFKKGKGGWRTNKYIYVYIYIKETLDRDSGKW